MWIRDRTRSMRLNPTRSLARPKSTALRALLPAATPVMRPVVDATRSGEARRLWTKRGRMGVTRLVPSRTEIRTLKRATSEGVRATSRTPAKKSPPIPAPSPRATGVNSSRTSRQTVTPATKSSTPVTINTAR